MAQCLDLTEDDGHTSGSELEAVDARLQQIEHRVGALLSEQAQLQKRRAQLQYQVAPGDALQPLVARC